MCQARKDKPRITLFSISSAAKNDQKKTKKNDCHHKTTMKLPRCGNSSSHNHQFTASSSSSSAAAAGALRGRAEDGIGKITNERVTMATMTRASNTSSNSSNGQVPFARRCESANAETAAANANSRRLLSLPSNGDAHGIRKSRCSHNVSKASTNPLLHFHRSRANGGEVVVDDDEDDDEPSGVRTPELPIPAPTTSHETKNGDGTGDGNVDEGDLTRMYDFATWNMYERIVSARRRRLTATTTSSETTSTFTASAAAAATTTSTASSHAPFRNKNHHATRGGGDSKRRACEEKSGGQHGKASSSSSASLSWLTQDFKSADQRTKNHGSSAVTVAAVASASSEAAAAAMTSSSKPQLYCKRSSIVSDSDSATLATADETDKSSTTSSSWSRTDSPGTFPAVGGGGSGDGNEAFLNPLRTAGNDSNPNGRTSFHPAMMTTMGGVDHLNTRHRAGFYTNIGGSSMTMNGGACLGRMTTRGFGAAPPPGRSSALSASPEEDNFIFQLEM